MHTAGAANIKFSKEMFQNVKVIGHVGNKFIAGILQWKSKGNVNKLLVLFDQHAADERVRLERFINGISLSFAHDKEPSERLRTVIHLHLPGVRFQGCADTVSFEEYMAKRGFEIKQNVRL
jgi:DNA mismatch repair ATPase MutL